MVESFLQWNVAVLVKERIVPEGSLHSYILLPKLSSQFCYLQSQIVLSHILHVTWHICNEKSTSNRIFLLFKKLTQKSDSWTQLCLQSALLAFPFCLFIHLKTNLISNLTCETFEHFFYLRPLYFNVLKFTIVRYTIFSST